MTLDITTLVILTIAVCLSLGISALIFSRLQQGTRGMRSWGTGMVGLGAGYLLLYLHPHMTDLGLAYGGWILCLASVLLMYHALLRITGDSSARTRFNILVVAGAAGGWAYFTYWTPSIHGLLDTTSVSISVITARAACPRTPPPLPRARGGSRRAAHDGSRLPARRNPSARELRRRTGSDPGVRTA